MARLRSNNVFGTITNDPLTNVGTTLNAAGLANLVAVASPNVAVITLDPNRVNGAPEIVYVTAHTGSATSATILRGQEGTAAREHPLGTFWVHAPTALDHRPFSPPACRVFHNANQNVTQFTPLVLAFNSERFDTDGMHSTVTNNSRITLNTAGIYVVTAGVAWNSNTAGRAEIFIRLNGSIVIVDQENDGPPGADGTQNGQAVGTTYKFAAGDFIEVVANQTGAATSVVNAVGNFSPEFSATWIGEG